jgi:hypothetical protein
VTLPRNWGGGLGEGTGRAGLDALLEIKNFGSVEEDGAGRLGGVDRSGEDIS